MVLHTVHHGSWWWHSLPQESFRPRFKKVSDIVYKKQEYSRLWLMLICVHVVHTCMNNSTFHVLGFKSIFNKRWSKRESWEERLTHLCLKWRFLQLPLDSRTSGADCCQRQTTKLDWSWVRSSVTVPAFGLTETGTQAYALCWGFA